MSINLDTDDQAWLDREARSRDLSVAELVKQAVHDYRIQRENDSRINLQSALSRTAGIWQQDNGLNHQRHLREEWKDRG
ncbi:hypothetical protein [Rhodanobacter sp. Soil772]|uniref:hypothetical protein n=1 Tax=Rhodanobacter sp. Soil772 TaxID=1736406 RepID=UPI00138EF3C8|nr:hypothetical protein [Rhodanobacter sp. Soil772]